MIKNKIRYLIIALVAGLLAILYNQYIMGMIFLTVVFLPVLLFAVLLVTYFYVKVELVSIVHVASKGERISAAVQINNPTMFPISHLNLHLSYRNAYASKEHKMKFNVSVDRKSKITVLCDINSKYAGNIEIFLKGSRIYDYFQIFSFHKKSHDKVRIAVLPNLHEVTENIMSNNSYKMVDSDIYSTVKGGDDPSEVYAIRGYREGDRPQKIHWKLSIKQNQLMIREFSEPMNCSVLILVDLCILRSGDVLPLIDALLESTLSLSYSLILRGQIHYISWYDEINKECKRVRIVRENDLFDAMDGLFQEKLYEDGEDSLHRYHAEHPNEQYTDFFYVTSKISELQLDALTLMGADTTKIIYIEDKTNPIHPNMKIQILEIGMKLMLIDVKHLQESIEQMHPYEIIGT